MPSIDPAELVRGVRKHEAWIDTAESFRIRLEGTWTRTAGGIADSTAELKRRFPTAEITETAFPHLKPLTHETGNLAFDRTRMYMFVESPDGGRLIHKLLWNGQCQFVHEKY